MSAVVELFGHPTDSAQADWHKIIADEHCPYIGKRCYKVRKSPPNQTIGTCSVNYGRRNDLLVICPARLPYRRQIFIDCLQLLTHHEPGNELHLITEVPIPGGNVDYFIVSARGGIARDFVGVELQTLDTTGDWWPERQRALQQLGVRRNDTEEDTNKPHGINWKMTAKTILMQLQHKIQTFQHVNRKLVLVIQDKLLEYMEKEFDFKHLSETAVIGDPMHMHAYQAQKLKEGGFRLELRRRLSTDADGIRSSLGLQAEANLDLEQMIQALQHRMSDETIFTPV